MDLPAYVGVESTYTLPRATPVCPNRHKVRLARLALTQPRLSLRLLSGTVAKPRLGRSVPGKKRAVHACSAHAWRTCVRGGGVPIEVDPQRP